ncbi:transcription factor domain-containing protein [Leptodontidium sp. MPI-SDFR-AT-0119]|nr:transcription factor domain-containing protein [Leptodontidium sp. MPI-SDFR-AT-0119]
MLFKSAISLSKHVFGTISMPVLQSVLLLIVHSLIDPDGCNNVWTLTHIAMAHSIDLGIHREVGNSGKFSGLAAEMRRRVFFCAYSLDRSISTIQGRPLGIGDDTFDVGLPIGIASEDPGGTVSPANCADTVSMPFSIQVFKMAQHISRIKFELYRLPSRADSVPRSSTLAATQSQIRHELDQWLAEASTAATAFGPSDQNLSI